MKRTIIAAIMVVAGAASAQMQPARKPVLSRADGATSGPEALFAGGKTSPREAARAVDVPAPVKVKNLAIEAEELRGEIPRPIDERLTGRNPAAQGSLIRARAEFLREIVKSAEDM